MYKKLYLAPMDDVTDRAFRELCKTNGADFMYTEFVAAESLARDICKSLNKISFSDFERPIGIQIFGNNLESIVKAVKIAEKNNPDEININCGCPVKKVVNKGYGAALLRDVDNLVSIIKNVVIATKIPITVKTRLGWDENSIIIEELVLKLQDVGVKKVIIHCRTRAQMYSGVARYEYLSKLKSNKNINIEIIGNGDVIDLESYKNMLNTGVDGVMIGRGAIGNPWIFNDLKNLKVEKKSIFYIIETIKKHIMLSLKYKDERSTILALRKHYSKYFKGLPNFKSIKMQLMNSNKISDVLEILDSLKL